MTSDMRAVIIPKSDQMNADDLLGGSMTITINKVAIRPGTEQPVSIFFNGDNGKPYKPCKSMARAMVSCWGPDANAYIGRSMTLYCDPKVLWAGMAVGGIRISHMSHIDSTATLMLTATKGSRKPFVVQPLKDAPKTAPAPETDEPDARETWVNEKIAWLDEQTDGDSVRAMLAEHKSAINMLAPQYRAPFDAALARAKDRISKASGDAQ